MAIDLLELEQESVVSLRTINRSQPRIRYTLCKLLLLSKGEQTIALDTNDKGRLLDLREGIFDWRFGGRVNAVTGNVVGIEFASDGYIAIAVEAFDELFALVSKI